MPPARPRGRDAPWRPPRGEAVLPLLALALFVLMFVASPLADIGVLERPLLGMVLLVVMLSGLFTLGAAAASPRRRWRSAWPSSACRRLCCCGRAAPSPC